MSLQRKFAILIGLLGLTVIGSLAAALLTVSAQQRQLAEPIRSMAQVLTELGGLKRDLQLEYSLLSSPDDDPIPPADRFRSAAADAGARLRTLSASDLYLNRAGRSTIVNLTERLRAFESAGLDRLRYPALGTRAIRWHSPAADAQLATLDAPDPRRGLTQRYVGVRELIERIERRILEDQSTAVDFGDSMRARLRWILLVALWAASLVAVLALILLRRWVVRPVADLRTAAGRLAAGDFSHRIAVSAGAGDELAQLSHEVNEMASQIRRMQDERVERERLAAIGEMVRRLAHNLRNPLAGIRGLAEITRNELSRDADLRENQERIIRAVDRFEKWLSDLLEVTRPLAINPEPGDVRRLLAGVIQTHAPMAQAKNITLELRDTDAPAEAVFDPRHLEHTLVAIMTNAIQASPAGGTVRLSARPTDARHWEIRIADQGPGVPPELLERIFNAYFTTKRDGSGIGLAVAQQVVRAHGGRIGVEKGLGPARPDRDGGEGATFVVCLPLTLPDQPSPPPGQTARNGEGVARIGRSGAPSGENSDHRGRGEHPALDPEDAGQGGA